MIKITMTDEPAQRLDYLGAVGKAVFERVQSLRTSIDHLNGINITNKAPDFTGYKSTTIALVNEIAEAKVDGKLFNYDDYEKGVEFYINGSAKIHRSVLDNVQAFLDNLLADSVRELAELLLCPPEKLSEKNEDIKSKFTINAGQELKIIELVFDYKYNKDIAAIVKKFFRAQSWGSTCAYCNIEGIDYLEAADGGVVTAPQLDHFYSEADHPLLCYSLFNLVPSDNHCNVYNKGKIRFDDIYFLNPHYSGFDNELHFSVIATGNIVQKIDLLVKPKPGNLFYDRMLGDIGQVDDYSRSGNINVFRLRNKYNNPKFLKKHVSKISEKINNKIAARRTLKDFLKKMRHDVSLDAHVAWYELDLMCSFDRKLFNETPYSKLHRDMHDDMFMADKRWFNKDIRQFIAENREV